MARIALRPIRSRSARQPFLAPPIERGRCRSPGCPRATTEHKPYCIEHLDRLPYVHALVRSLGARAAEEHAASLPAGWRAVDARGARAFEIIEVLAQRGAQTPKRLAITTEIDVASLEGYLVALSAAGFVEALTLGSRRGTPRRVVQLTERGRVAACAAWRIGA